MRMPRTSSKWPDLPLKIKLFAKTLTFAVEFTRRSDGSVNRRLMSFFDPKISPSNKPIRGVRTADVTVDGTRNLWFRLLIPSSTNDVAGGEEFSSVPVIFFYHGGGFVYLGADSKLWDDFCRRLARELPAVIVSVNYRLAPEHRYPAAYEDCIDVLKFIDDSRMENFPQFADLKHCFLAGDSAGGNIAHAVAIKAAETEFRNIKLDGIISMQPFFGGEERTESEIKLAGAPFITPERTDRMWKLFLPVGSDRDHPAANVFGPNGVDISGMKFPATILFVGGFDPLIDWQKRYYEGLKKAGKEAYLVEYPNAIHSFYAYPELKESALLIQEVKDFMQKQITATK